MKQFIKFNLQGRTLKVTVSAVIGAIFLLNPQLCIAQVKINEFSSYETSGDWIELYAEEKVDISGWIIRDSASSIVKTIDNNTYIGSSSAYLVVEVSNRLNRGEDNIKLLKSDDSTIVDQINYGDGVDVCAPNSGESSGRKPNGSSNLVRFSGQTKDSSNGDAENSCPSPSPTPTPTPSPSPSPSPSPNPSPSPVIKISPSPSPLKKFEVTNLENSQSTGSSLMMLASKSGEVKGASEASQAGKTNKTWIIAVVLILMGLGLIGGVGVVIYKDQKYNSTDVGKSVKKKAGKEKN